MSFSPRQLAAHWVPGFALLGILFLADKQNGHPCLNQFGEDWQAAIALVVIAAAGFIGGNLLDAIRDLLDEVLDHLPGCEIKWEFILEAPADRVQRMDDFYFVPYVLSANMVLGLLIGGLADLFFPLRFPLWAWLLGLLSALVFVQDAWRLRRWIVKGSQKLLDEAHTTKKSENSPA
jgi:hypothetical protein